MDTAWIIWSAALFFAAGFTIGKICFRLPENDAQNRLDTASGITEPLTEYASGNLFKKEGSRRESVGEKKISTGQTIGSPVAGSVSHFRENGKEGARITPKQGLLYAPAPGKIIRLFPTGNAMLLRTDFGLDLYIQAGIGTDDMESRLFRTRIVKNEVVPKGKLLLEFDIEGLVREGFDPSVTVTVEDPGQEHEITLCETAGIKAGDSLMWVSHPQYLSRSI